MDVFNEFGVCVVSACGHIKIWEMHRSPTLTPQQALMLAAYLVRASGQQDRFVEYMEAVNK